MVQNNTRLALENLVADEWILVALFFVGVLVGLEDDVVDQLLDALVVEELGHHLRRIDKPSLNIFFVEDVLQTEVVSVEKAIKILSVVQATGLNGGLPEQKVEHVYKYSARKYLVED